MLGFTPALWRMYQQTGVMRITQLYMYRVSTAVYNIRRVYTGIKVDHKLPSINVTETQINVDSLDALSCFYLLKHALDRDETRLQGPD